MKTDLLVGTHATGAAGLGRVSNERSSKDRRSSRLIVAMVLLLTTFVGAQARAEAASFFGGAGVGSTRPICLGGGKVKVEVSISTNVFPQTVGRHLFYRNGGSWYQVPWVEGTNYEFASNTFTTTMTFSGPPTWRNFYVYYYWFQNGVWNSGTPAGEQTAVWC